MKARLRGVACLVAAAVLVVAGSPAAEAADASERYEIQFGIETREVVLEGDLAEGEGRTLSIPVPETNVTAIRFVLSWVETGESLAVTDEDSFSLAVRDPGGRLVESVRTGNDGFLDVCACDLNPIPQPFAVTGSLLEVAPLLSSLTGTKGRGTWTVDVTLLDTGSPEGVPVDEGNHFLLSADVHRYEPETQRVVSLRGAGGPSVATGPDVWLLAMVALGATAGILGGYIVRQGRKAR
ncbi:MAG: hypothetical protein ACT4PT_01635 [Methanobacteriota archaeon]